MPNGTLAVTFQFQAGFEDSLDIPADDFSLPRSRLYPGVGGWRRYRAPAMRLNGSISSNQDIRHPNCPNCGTPMWLAGIEPDKPGQDKRTFECPACESLSYRGREIQVEGTAVAKF